jgi:hypothetical protein
MIRWAMETGRPPARPALPVRERIDDRPWRLIKGDGDNNSGGRLWDVASPSCTGNNKSAAALCNCDNPGE